MRRLLLLLIVLLMAHAAAAQDITDSFNRADSSTTLGTTDTGQSWNVLQDTNNGLYSVWGISSNKAYDATPNPVFGGFDHVYVESGVADTTISVTVSNIDANSDVGLVFRIVDAFNYYLFSCDNTVPEFVVYKNVNNSLTLLSTVTATVANGDVLSVVLSGSSIITKQNGTTKNNVTDSTFLTATQHGMRQNGQASSLGRFDDFRITRGSAATGRRTLTMMGVGPQ